MRPLLTHRQHHDDADKTEFVEQTMLEKSDRLLTMHWVTKRKGAKVEKRLVVVGRFRFYSIKRSNFGGKKTVSFLLLFFPLFFPSACLS